MMRVCVSPSLSSLSFRFCFLLLLCAETPLVYALAGYEQWKHQSSITILTTPEGADLPASASEENFPLLVRLHSDTFDFQQASPSGADIRFSCEGTPLAYQIEHWNSEMGEASIWVRMPLLKGNSRQSFTMHWGRPGAPSESNGRAVFNESNGFSVVMHFSDPAGTATDEAGTLSLITDRGTLPCPGAVGFARWFEAGRGIACGEKLTGLPSDLGAHSSEAWVLARNVNGTVLGWGNEQAQGKVVMGVRSPPHVGMDCYFSSGNVSGVERLPLCAWSHVVHTYKDGVSRLYLNGRLDAASSSKNPNLNIRTPARMWVGGWYNNFRFDGAIDEVRISRVERSADWIRLCYENQKPHQTLVGMPLKARKAAKVHPLKLAIDEAAEATLSIEADGADKVYWILKTGSQESVVAADRRSFVFKAGRVTSDVTRALQVKAVYADGVQTWDVPVEVRNTIPEPRFSLSAPRNWNGREAIEVVPKVDNLEELRRSGADKVTFSWEVLDGAVIRDVRPDRLVLQRSQYSGPIRVQCVAENGGEQVVSSARIEVTEPASDSILERIPDPDEKPEEGQFYPRDNKNEGTLFYAGAMDKRVDSVFLRVFAGDTLFWHGSETPRGDRAEYSFRVKLKPGLVKYRVEFGERIEAREEVLNSVGGIMCGDAFLIDGQSNALATDTREEAPRETSEWVRSYGGPTGRGDAGGWVRDRYQEAALAGLTRPNLWCSPVWKRDNPGQIAEIGWWGMELAKEVVSRHQIPVCIIQAAVGGSRIDEHQPAIPDRSDLSTMYGRMLWRVRHARLTHGVRAVLWHQGENDQGSDGPTGGYGWETYQRYFVDLAAAWKQDMPNISRYYAFQIWPNACGMGGKNGSGDRLRDVQRILPRFFSNLEVLSTLGIFPGGGCHYPLQGWSRFSQMVLPLLERDFYGVRPSGPVGPPALRRVFFAGEDRTEILLQFDQPVVWTPELAREFYLDEIPDQVVAGEERGTVLSLKLREKSFASRITYLRERDWNQSRLLVGRNGLAALTFCDVPIEVGRAMHPAAGENPDTPR